MPRKIPSGYCGCCGNGPISETALWCDGCAEHVSRDSTLHLWERTYEAVHGQPCPLTLWRCAHCGHDTMQFLPTRRRHVCAKCFEMVPEFIPGTEHIDIEMPTEEEIAEIDRDMEAWAARSPKDQAVVLYINGHFASPAEAAKSIGYEWTEEDQTEHDRESYVRAATLDKLLRVMEAVKVERQEAKEGQG